MTRLAGLLVALAATVTLLSCEETTTQVRQSTFRVEVAIEESPFVVLGDTLVNDTVRFVGSVTEDGRAFSAAGQRFKSDDPSIVRIDSASTGKATFVGTGTTTVTVTYDEPVIQGSEKLQATMTVRVTEYVVDLTLTSTVTGRTVPAAEGLVNDTVRVDANVTKDGEPVTPTGLAVTSSNAAVAEPVTGTNTVAFKSAGPAKLTVTFEAPNIPGELPLTETLDVTVSDLQVLFDVGSLVDQSFLTAGDTLVSDHVDFDVTVIEGGDTVQASVANWTSSDTTVVRILDAMTGEAEFVDTGSVTVSVSFADADLPGEPFQKSVRVWTYAAAVEVESNINPGPLADTLVTDSVTFRARVTSTKSGALVPDSLLNSTSDNPQVVEILAPASGRAWFPDTGQAVVTLRLARPRLPRDTVEGSLPLRVTTFLAQIQPPGAPPEMGDTVQYGVDITDTRDGSTVANPLVTFNSSDPAVLEFLDPATGVALARDVGQAVARVVLNDPSLPAGTVSDSAPPLVIATERFYGTFSATSGSFGTTAGGDSIIVAASPVHFFTDTTRLEFPNGTVGFVESATPDTLVFLVPAAADTGQLVIRNLRDDLGGFRDNVPTRITFNGPGSNVVDDFFEPNDTFPLLPSVKLTVDPANPFEALLAIDPSKTAPPDTNFFYLVIPSGTKTLQIRAEWQQDANLDFFICNGENADPPSFYTSAFCTRPDSDNSSLKNGLEQDTKTLSAGVHVFAFYCPATAGQCPALPLTYKVTMQEQ